MYNSDIDIDIYENIECYDNINDVTNILISWKDLAYIILHYSNIKDSLKRTLTLYYLELEQSYEFIIKKMNEFNSKLIPNELKYENCVRNEIVKTTKQINAKYSKLKDKNEKIIYDYKYLQHANKNLNKQYKTLDEKYKELKIRYASVNKSYGVVLTFNPLHFANEYHVEFVEAHNGEMFCSDTNPMYTCKCKCKCGLRRYVMNDNEYNSSSESDNDYDNDSDSGVNDLDDIDNTKDPDLLNANSSDDDSDDLDDEFKNIKINILKKEDQSD